MSSRVQLRYGLVLGGNGKAPFVNSRLERPIGGKWLKFEEHVILQAKKRNGHILKCVWTRLGVLIFHKEVESFGVLAEDLDGFLHHLREGWISIGVAFQLVAHVLWFK